MPERGLEPPRLAATDSKSVVATITPLGLEQYLIIISEQGTGC